MSAGNDSVRLIWLPFWGQLLHINTISRSAISRGALTGIGIASAIVALPAMAQAQTSYPAPMSDTEVQSLPPEYRTGPAVED